MIFCAGRAIARTGQTALATELLIKFLESEPQNEHKAMQQDLDANISEAYRWLGWLARLKSDFAQAGTWLQQALNSASPAQQMAVECELIRLSLAEGKMSDIPGALDRLYPMARSNPHARAELMLVSAEVSNAVGDSGGAMELARAAVNTNDDRTSALLALLELRSDIADQERLQQHLMNIPGRRFDTLAVRNMLAQSLGLELEFELPAATKELMLNKQQWPDAWGKSSDVLLATG